MAGLIVNHQRFNAGAAARGSPIPSPRSPVSPVKTSVGGVEERLP
jgi:hypothetical protein